VGKDVRESTAEQRAGFHLSLGPVAFFSGFSETGPKPRVTKCVNMDPISTLKMIREIIKKTEDRELVKLILDLQKEVFTVERRSLKLAAELATLKRQLQLLAQMHTCPPFDYYFQEGDDVPFCPKCWEIQGHAVHLPEPEPSGPRVRRDCRVCKETYWEPAITREQSKAHHG
jgi:hypothetical protein